MNRSTLPPDLLQLHVHNTFIETGTNEGAAVQLALDAGFACIHSIEIDQTLHEQALQRFSNCPQVHLHHGDTLNVLPTICKQLSARATFWLDAHACGQYTCTGTTRAPVLQEIDIIASSAITDHTIIIDDINCLENFNNEEVRKNILQINPAYVFTNHHSIMICGNTHPHATILLAHVPESINDVAASPSLSADACSAA